MESFRPEALRFCHGFVECVTQRQRTCLRRTKIKRPFAADQNHIQLYRFFRLRLWGCHRHLGLDRVGIDERETGMTNRSRQRGPSLSARMMISKDKGAFVLEYAMAFGENRSKFQSKLIRSLVLDFLFATRGQITAKKAMRLKALPSKEEVCQFGVMDVVEKWWVRHDEINRLAW